MTNREGLNYHEARLLILLKAFEGGIVGLTKLAKLDFLLRYPTMLERVLRSRNQWIDPAIAATSSERHAVESPMIRYKYGPWDDRYYPVLGALIAKGLLETRKSTRAINFFLTEQGKSVASELSSTEEWGQVEARASELKRSFNINGTQLKQLIYSELPSVIDRPYRAVIDPEG